MTTQNEEGSKVGAAEERGAALGQDSCLLPPDRLQRIRWRCRRGLLELDIVLGRFVDAHYVGLSASERNLFEAFLDMADNPLWDLVSGKNEPIAGEQANLLKKIKSV